MNFPINPVRVPDETELGYALRFAKRNGYLYHSRVFSKTKANQLLKGQKKAEEILGLARKHTSDCPLPSSNSPLYEYDLMLNPKVCLSCIKEKAIIKNDWQDPLMFSCSDHKETLVSHCNTCGSALSWDISILHGKCTNPNCTKNLVAEPYDDKFSDPKVVADCLLMSHFIDNQNCTIIKKTKFYQNDSYYESVLSGYSILSSPERFESWANETIGNKPASLPTPFRVHEITLLKEHLQLTWQSVENFEALDEPNTDSSVELSSFQLSMADACSLLNTNNQGIVELYNLELIHTLSGNRPSHKTAIDIAPLFQWLGLNIPQPGMKALNEQRRTLKCCLANPTDLIVSAKQGHLLLGYKPGKDFLSSLHCHPDELEHFAKQRLEDQQDEVIDLKTASEISGMSVDDLLKLRKIGKLPIPKGYRFGDDSLCLVSDMLKAET